MSEYRNEFREFEREGWWTFPRVVLMVGTTVALISAGGFALRSIMLPANVALENRVFHESQQYTDGMANDLAQFRVDYYAPGVNEGSRDVIRATIRQRFGAYPADKLSPELANFLREMRGF
jgi:hypothetical protein